MRWILLSLVAFGSGAMAQSLDLSTIGTPSQVETSPAESLRLPTKIWAPDTEVNVIEGATRRTAYQYQASTRTTLQLIEPPRAILENDGYTTVFACSDAACGGFDFRFQLDLLPEPSMHVDLGDFRYVLMEKPGASPHTVSLVASATATTGFLHVTEVSEAVFPDPSEGPATPIRVPDGGLISTLEATGRAVLSDLEFQTGSADLGLGPFETLSTLSDWLAANPSARVVLVGHTDAVGSLEGNTALSRSRAAAVVSRLADTFGTNPSQLQSAGVGFLSPAASNLTPEGRAANRRVEVVLLSLE